MKLGGRGRTPAEAATRELGPVLGIFLFGHARLTLDGAPWLMATPRKTLQLLAYLVLHRDAAVTRDYLSYLLYPDDEEESARAKMRATLYDLQRALPAVPERNWLVVDGTSVRWNPDAAVLLDVDEFEAALADPERLEEAVALYAGDLLEALYDEWIVAPRERLRSHDIRLVRADASGNAEHELEVEGLADGPLGREHQRLLDVAETLLMIPDLFGWLLPGRRAGERTDASTSGWSVSTP